MRKYDSRVKRVEKVIDDASKPSVDELIAQSRSIEEEGRDLAWYMQQLKVTEVRFRNVRKQQVEVDHALWCIFGIVNKGTEQKGNLFYSEQDRKRAHEFYYRRLNNKESANAKC